MISTFSTIYDSVSSKYYFSIHALFITKKKCNEYFSRVITIISNELSGIKNLLIQKENSGIVLLKSNSKKMDMAKLKYEKLYAIENSRFIDEFWFSGNQLDYHNFVSNRIQRWIPWSRRNMESKRRKKSRCRNRCIGRIRWILYLHECRFNYILFWNDWAQKNPHRKFLQFELEL